MLQFRSEQGCSLGYPQSFAHCRPVSQFMVDLRWKDRTGAFRRDVGDGEHSEITIGERVYRVRTSEIA